MKKFQFESLETRETPAVLLGSVGDDTISVIQVNPGYAVVATTFGDGAEGGLSSIYGDVRVESGEGNDTVFLYGAKDAYVDLGDGDDQLSVDGAEGSIVAIGGEGSDTLQTGSGNDLVVGDSLRDEAVLAWGDREAYLDIVEVSANVVDDGVEDTISVGKGFDYSWDAATRRVDYSYAGAGQVFQVSTSEALLQALSVAQSGDQIQLSAGDFVLPFGARDIAGVTLTGAGAGSTFLRSQLILDNGRDMTPSLVENLTIDVTGASFIPYYKGAAWVHVAAGEFYFDDVEMTGAGLASNKTLFLASSVLGDVTKVSVADSWFHDNDSDLISTAGNFSNPIENGSFVALYDVLAHGSGPNPQDQVLTAHNGFPLIAVGGFFWGSSINVVAPDAAFTRLDLYFAEVVGRIQIPSTISQIAYCQITTPFMLLWGTLRDSEVTWSAPNWAMISDQPSSQVLRNTLRNPSGFPGKPLGGLGLAIDNVFEGWN